MERHVYIERRNIPMKQVFAEERVKEAVSGHTRLLTAARQAGLLSSPRTLRQYICLSGEERLGEPYLTHLEDIFAWADKTSPITIEDQYSWLRQEVWTLEMKNVSYYKVTADLGSGRQCGIRRIHWQGEYRTLWIWPEEIPESWAAQGTEACLLSMPADIRALFQTGVCSQGLQGGRIDPDAPPAWPIYVEDPASLFLFIKILLLEGRADLAVLQGP